MPAIRIKSRSFWMTAVMGLVGAVAGMAIGCSGGLPALEPAWTLKYPLPHHIPKYPGGVSLRFAMVHDVIHERFARHGRAYYQERNRQVRKQLDAGKANMPADGEATDRYFALYDDLGAGLDYLVRHDEAVDCLRAKLREQQARKYSGRQLYTTYANLGTFLIHGNFRRALAGSGLARRRLREGLQFIHQSIEVNPQAHFGREIWQAVAVEFFLAAMENPKLLLKYDLAGNRLDADINPARRDCLERDSWVEAIGRGSQGARAAAYLSNRGSFDELFRAAITRVGAEDDWKQEVRTSHKVPVPFDEPTLGIIGMWRLGGGANPHFALALGEIMMRVGQRYIAWCAYERAARMADRFWPDQHIQKQLIAHCRQRQATIENQLPNPGELRSRFEAELKHGVAYQQAYQAYEAERIAQGVSIDDPHFYDAFQARQGKIASPVGQADRLVVRRTYEYALPGHAMMLFAGLFAFGTACILRFRGRRQGIEWDRAKEESP